MENLNLLKQKSEKMLQIGMLAFQIGTLTFQL